jgi:hypothetical protein
MRAHRADVVAAGLREAASSGGDVPRIRTVAGLFLGGDLAPAGLAVCFLRAGFDEVVEVLTSWRRGLGQELDVASTTLPAALVATEPFHAPWTREVLFDCGQWTSYLNNGIDGGDPTAAAPHLANLLGVDLFVAIHAPLRAPGHGSTQLWVLGPSGTPPLNYRRSIAAYCADGRWSWRADGVPLPFEQVERYTARRIRDRFDRSLLLDYLEACDIRADEPSFYGDGLTVTQRVTFALRSESAADVRKRFGW